MDTFSYSFDEFLRHHKDWGTVRHYDHVTIGGVTRALREERDHISSVLQVRDYMEQLYGVTDEAAEKAKLFALIQMFIAERAADFDFGTLAVVGREQGLISVHVLRAVHHIFTSQPLSALGHGPTTEQVIQLAQKYEAENPDT